MIQQKINRFRESMSAVQLLAVEELLVRRFGPTTFHAIGEEETLKLHLDVLHNWPDNSAGS